LNFLCARLCCLLHWMPCGQKQSTRDAAYRAIFTKGVDVDIDWERPLETMSSWPWIYSMNVVLVHLPARWISMAECIFFVKAMAPPARRECEPTCVTLKPSSSVPRIFTVSCTAFTMSWLLTYCQAILVLSRNAQIKVFGVAPSQIKSMVCDTNARMGQHMFPFLSA